MENKYWNGTEWLDLVSDSAHAKNKLLHKQNSNCTQTGTNSNAEGSFTTASGNNSHAEGSFTVASNYHAHAEGTESKATGMAAHAEGGNSLASGENSHAEGGTTFATDVASHAEGLYTTASSQASHAEGIETISSGVASHAEGRSSRARGDSSHAEGQGSTAILTSAHAEGFQTTSVVGKYYKSTPITDSEFQLLDVIGLAVNDIVYLKSRLDGLLKAQITVINGNTITVQYLDAYAGEPLRLYCPYIIKPTTTANMGFTHSEGLNTLAMGPASHAEGAGTITNGSYSHAEGNGTIADFNNSHSEGINTLATGGTDCFKILNVDTVAKSITVQKSNSIADMPGVASIGIVISNEDLSKPFIVHKTRTTVIDVQTNTLYVESIPTLEANAQYKFIVYGSSPYLSSHVEGTKTFSNNSHAEGMLTQAIGNFSHAEGNETISTGESSHAEGQKTVTLGMFSHTEGSYTFTAAGYLYNITACDNTNKTITLDNVTNLAVGDLLQLKALTLSAQMTNPLLLIDVPITAINGLIVTLDTDEYLRSNYGIAIKTETWESASHAEGTGSTAIGNSSHAEGNCTLSSGDNSHTEGVKTTAKGSSAHAEGANTIASGDFSHAEGAATNAEGLNSHSEGAYTRASGTDSHAEGTSVVAVGESSHAQNMNTVAQGKAQTVIGKFNNGQGNPTSIQDSDLAFIIGNGTSDMVRSNAMTVTWDGTLDIKKAILVNGQPLTAGATNILNGNRTDSVRTIASKSDYTMGVSAFAEGGYTVASGDYSHAEGNSSKAIGNFSHAEGGTTTTNGQKSHAEGELTIANGFASHTEGSRSISEGANSHAEGEYTISSGGASHAEGSATMACHGKFYKILSYNNTSKTITLDTVTDLNVNDLLNIKIIGSNPSVKLKIPVTAINGLVVTLNTTETLAYNWKYAIKEVADVGVSSHAEGVDTVANSSSHAEGKNTLAIGVVSHAEGMSTKATGNFSHAEGQSTTASGDTSHAEGWNTQANGMFAHVEGSENIAATKNTHAEGRNTLAHRSSVSFITAFDNTAKTITLDSVSGISVGTIVKIKLDSSPTLKLIEVTVVNGLIITLNTTETIDGDWKCVLITDSTESTHAEGENTLAAGYASHAEGQWSKSTNVCTHAEGFRTTANARYSHSEGQETIASGEASHTEGVLTKATYYYTHAEGRETLASNWNAHAEGYKTIASGEDSHAEGRDSVASGNQSHAQNKGTIANGDYQTALGKYNVSDTTSLVIVGKGTNDTNRANALVVEADGSINIASGAQFKIDGVGRVLKGTATLATATWAGSSAPYSYTLTVTGILSTDTPHLDRVTGTDATAAALINTAWGLIAGYAVKPQTSANTITFYASAKPTVAIPIMYEVIR